MKKTKKKKWIALLLAFFFSMFTFIYSWKKDKIKFIILLVLQLIFLNVIVGLILWIGTLGLISLRKQDWYDKY